MLHYNETWSFVNYAFIWIYAFSLFILALPNAILWFDCSLSLPILSQQAGPELIKSFVSAKSMIANLNPSFAGTKPCNYVQ